MSRKNLSRTVIEGGRYYSNCWDRRQSHRDERASTRAWLDRVAADNAYADELAVPPRRHVYKMFHDKLAPAERWLRAQVGRPWDKVFSELRAKFDSRTVAGAHVVNSHMLGWVDRGNAETARYRHDYFVIDRHGILREAAFYEVSWSRLRKELAAFAQGRRAAKTYMGWWWFVYVPKGVACYDNACRAKHEVFDKIAYHAKGLVPQRAMTRGEVRRLDRMHPHFRGEIVT